MIELSVEDFTKLVDVDIATNVLWVWYWAQKSHGGTHAAAAVITPHP